METQFCNKNPLSRVMRLVLRRLEMLRPSPKNAAKYEREEHKDYNNYEMMILLNCFHCVIVILAAQRGCRATVTRSNKKFPLKCNKGHTLQLVTRTTTTSYYNQQIYEEIIKLKGAQRKCCSLLFGGPCPQCVCVRSAICE